MRSGVRWHTTHSLMTSWYLGTMGFSYKQWHGIFYPAGMAARNYLAHYSQRFNTVEMDSTFYGTPQPQTVHRWTAVTPPHFIICPKTPRHITHELRLVRAYEAMHRFLETMSLLENKLGPILIQLPPDFTTEETAALRTFLNQLPPDKQYAVEFRHRSWDKPETATLLKQHHVAWVATDYIHLRKQIHHTTDFLYLRFIGPHGQFQTKDRELVDKTAVLQQWYQQIQPHLAHVNAIYGYFNNDYAGYSPATCNKFKQIVGLGTEEIRVLQQGRLF